MSATSQSDRQQTRSTDGSTNYVPARDQAAQHSSKDKNSQVLASTTSQQSESQATRSPAPASAAAVNAIMGPPPPKDEKTGSRWERWRRDRKEAEELGMPSQESSGRWGVKNFAA